MNERLGWIMDRSSKRFAWVTIAQQLSRVRSSLRKNSGAQTDEFITYTIGIKRP